MPSIEMDPAWVPDLPAEALFDERAWLSGAILTGVGYGVVLTLTFMCLSQLFPRVSDRMNKFWILYVSCVFLFATMFIAGNSKMAQLSFVDYRNFAAPGVAGGPSSFEEVMFSLPVSEMGNVAFVLSNWFADAVVVWRCLVVYQGTAISWWIIAIAPILTYLASWTLGLLWLIQVSASSPWSSTTINFTLPYFWTSFALNVSMTLLISLRLLMYRIRISRVMGRNYGRQYTSIASMIVESALLYTGFQLAFIVPFALGHPSQTIFLQPLSQVQVIAPLLIIFRVSSGRAWTTETSTRLFNSTPPSDIEMRKNVQFPDRSSKDNMMPANSPMTFAKAEGLSTTGTASVGTVNP